MKPTQALTSRPRPLQITGALSSCIIAMGLAGCGSISSNSVDAAQVRFVNATGDAPAVDLYVNGVGAAYNLSSGTVTSYVAVSPGEYRISANRTNSSQVLVNAHATLGQTRQYTAVLSGGLSNLQTVIYPDANTSVPAGMLSVRVLNEAATMGPVDVYLVAGAGSISAATPTVRELGVAASTGYENLPAEKSYSVAVVPAGGPATPGDSALLPGVSLSGGSGAVRTLVISDAVGSKSKSLTGFVLNDFDTP